MKRIFACAMLVLGLMAPALAAESSQLIRAGDTLDIQIAGERSMSGEYQVTSFGDLVVPYLDIVYVKGLSTADFAELLRGRLKNRNLTGSDIVITILKRASETESSTDFFKFSKSTFKYEPPPDAKIAPQYAAPQPMPAAAQPAPAPAAVPVKASEPVGAVEPVQTAQPAQAVKTAPATAPKPTVKPEPKPAEFKKKRFGFSWWQKQESKDVKAPATADVRTADEEPAQTEEAEAVEEAEPSETEPEEPSAVRTSKIIQPPAPQPMPRKKIEPKPEPVIEMPEASEPEPEPEIKEAPEPPPSPKKVAVRQKRRTASVPAALPLEELEETSEEDASSAINAGDKLRIRVANEADLSGEFVVTPAGTITYPILGDIDTAGKSAEALRVELQDKLGADYLFNPQVEVELLQSQQNSVDISGAVGKPGNYLLAPNMTLLRLITQAGGLTGSPSATKVQVVRASSGGRKKSYDLDFSNIVKGKIPDIKLERGDLIFVEQISDRAGDYKGESRKNLVSVLGMVAKPGNYRVSDDMQLVRLIAEAGGFSAGAATGRVRLLRNTKEGKQVMQIDAGAIMSGRARDITLKDGDVLIVQESYF